MKSNKPKKDGENGSEEMENSTEAAPEPKKEEDLHDKYLRLAADFDNFRKRVHKEKIEYVRYASENLIKELLPVLDNFERALDHAQKNTDYDSLKQGIDLTFSQLKNALLKFGVRSEDAIGKPFDPITHEAVSYVTSNEHPPHTVVGEMQKAYFLHDRLIRPAMVAVSKGDDNPSAEETKENPQID